MEGSWKERRFKCETLSLRYLLVGGFSNESHPCCLHRADRGARLRLDGGRRPNLSSEDVLCADLRAGHLRPGHLRSGGLRAGHLCSGDLRAGHLRAEDLPSEARPDLPAEDLRAEDLLPADLCSGRGRCAA